MAGDDDTSAARSASRTPRPLVRLDGARPESPQWFKDLLAVPFDEGGVDVEGAEIRWRRWGEAGKPGLLLVHGGAAHKGWWDFIAPALAADYRVVALDLSGMGDSEWRPAYSMRLYAREVIAVAEDAGLTEGGAKPIVVGHSFGGWISLQTAHDFGDRLKCAVALDSPIRPPKTGQSDDDSPPSRPRRAYGSLAEALGRFNLLPPQECENLFLLDHIARGGLRRTDGPDGESWTWKFDPALWSNMDYGRAHPIETLPEVTCPLAAFRGEGSALVTDAIWAYMREVLPEGTPMVSIPGAQHHVMLDQPIAVIAGLKALLAGWP